ncbi:Ig-like domain-containing protein, partial [Acinetobacter ursingii]|uniref:Ig-like domain-containing protein n=1 Tax=Acinetobacter ursingii TaxID=108980 RepID=UPI001250A261
MTKFVVTEKKSLVKNTIDNSQVILKAAAIVQVNLHREDVAEFIQDGNNLILKLQNGDVITIQNFFVQYEDNIVSDLVFEDNDCAFLWFDWNNGAPLFKEISGLEVFLPIASGSSSGALLPWIAGGLAVIGGTALGSSGSSGKDNNESVNKAPQVLEINKQQPISVIEDVPKTGVIINVTDPDSDHLTYSVSEKPTHGTVSIDSATGGYTYTPNANYNGSDSFEVTVADGKGGTTTVTIPVTIAAVNDAPTATASSISTDEDKPVTGNVVGQDVDGDTLTYTIATGPANGTVSIDPATGGYTYTPNANYNGSDSFEVTVADGKGGTTTVTIPVTIAAVNDAPTATASSISTDEDKPVTGNVIGLDVDGDSLSYTVSTNPSHGTVSIDPATGGYTYTPNANYNGSDSFEVTVADGKGGTTTITIPVTIAAVNDAPTATASSISTDEDKPVTGNVVGQDVDGDSLSYTVSSNPSHGTVSIDSATGGYTYTPNANYNGSDSFEVTVADGKGGTTTITIPVTIAAVNDAPTATASSISTDEDKPVTGNVVGQDVDGDSLSYTVSTNPSHGTVSIDPATGGYTYTPNANYNGSDSFEVTVADG